MTQAHTSTVVIGLGKTGYSCARYLAQQGIDFSVVDTREQPPYLQVLKEELPEIKIGLGPLDGDMLSQAEVLYVSPGIAKDEPAIAKALSAGSQLSGDIDLFCQAVNAPIVAITGSNAKSTVTSLVGLMAEMADKKVAVGGNIGTPVLELLEQDGYELYVLELSSFQLEITHHLEAEVATVLNISPDHMDRYNDLEDYRQAKHRIFNNCHQIVVNAEDPQLPARLEDSSESNVWRYGLVESDSKTFGVINHEGVTYLAFDGQKLLSASEMKVKGSHNVSNALAALAIGYAVDLPVEPMLEALKKFTGLKHRCQWLESIDGVDYYNDSKGTNVGASVAALHGLGDSISGRIVLIAGGRGKGADFSDLKEPINTYCRGLVLIGESADAIAKVANLSGSDQRQVQAGSMYEALQHAHTIAQSGDIVLLSPACSSFDMFDNFEARGDVFIDEVMALAARSSK